MVFGGTHHPAVSPLSARVYEAPLRYALAYNYAPCGFRSPSSFRIAPLRYFGETPRCYTPPILACHLSGLISYLFSTAYASLLPIFIGFHFHFRGFITPLRYALRPYRHPLRTQLRSCLRTSLCIRSAPKHTPINQHHSRNKPPPYNPQTSIK